MAKNFLGQLGPATKLYVAPGGTGDGSIDTPFGSLAGARDAIRAMPRPLTQRVEVLLREGEYRLSQPLVLGPQDSGEPGKTITYRSYPGENATLNGGVQLANSWVSHDANVWKISLPGQAKFRTLVVNGSRKTRARWPEKGSYHVMQTYDPDDGIPAKTHKTFIRCDTTGGTPANTPTFAAGEEGEFVAFDNFMVQRHKVLDSQNPIQNVDQIIPKITPVNFAFDLYPHYDRYYWEGSLSFLTGPGQFHYDHTNEELYYWPEVGETPNTASMIVDVPQVDQAIVASGTDIVFPEFASSFSWSCFFRTTFNDVGDPSNQFWMKSLVQNVLTGAGFSISVVQKEIPDAANLYTGIIEARFGGSYIYAVDFPNLNDGEWHHVTAVFDRGQAVARVYVDGVESSDYRNASGGSSNSINGSAILNEAAPRIGTQGGPPWSTAFAISSYWLGQIDDVVLADRVLTSQEAANLANKDYTGIAPAMHMPLNGDYSYNRDSIAAIRVRELWLWSSTNSAFDSLTTFINGGVGHNPCLDFSELPGLSPGHAASYVGFREMPGEQCKHLSFAGLEITAIDYPELPDEGWSTDAADYEQFISAALDFKFCRSIKISNCNVHAVGGNGIVFYTSEYSSVVGNSIFDIGVGSIIYAGPTVVAAEKAWDNHVCEYNTIHDFGWLHPVSGSGIWTNWVGHIRIQHNVLYDGARGGVKVNNKTNGLLYNNESIEIAYNLIHDCGKLIYDIGGITVNGYSPNSWIHHNHVYNLIDTPDTTDFWRPDDLDGDGTLGNNPNEGNTRGMYLDEGSSGWLVENNLVYACSAEVMFWNKAGPDCIVRNNIFAKPLKIGSACQRTNIREATWHGDGVVGVKYIRSIGNTVNYNIYYAEEQRAGWSLRCPRNQRAAIAVGGVDYPAGDFDYNIFSYDRIGQWDSYRVMSDLGDIDSAAMNEEGPISYAVSEYGIEVNSIVENPQFRFNDEGDYFVTNTIVLDHGFVNFVDDPQFPKLVTNA